MGKMESFGVTANGLWVKVRYFLTFSIVLPFPLIYVSEVSVGKLFLLTNYFLYVQFTSCVQENGDFSNRYGHDLFDEFR